MPDCMALILWSYPTRCRWKAQVADGLCEREVPPVRMLAGAHQIKCHLPDAVLASMEPVFTRAEPVA